MRSELSFLMDLFLNEEIPTTVKKLVADRIREVEQNLTASESSLVGGAPRAVRTEERRGAPPFSPAIPPIIPTPPMPGTQAAAQALQYREELLRRGMGEKPEPGRTSPRKI